VSRRPTTATLRFGANLRRHRRRAERSQEGLGQLAGLHRTEVGHLEKGTREPRLITIIKLATVLELPMDELCDGIAWQPAEGQPQGVVLVDGRPAG
jgi:DNA-binding XRE family transcriptional regulator